MRKRLLVADDKLEVVESLCAALRHDYDVETATSGTEVLRKMAEAEYDGLVIDVDFGPGMSGLEAAEIVREMNPDVKILIFSAYSYNDDLVRRVVELGATFKLKPLRVEDIAEYIGRA